MSYGIVLDSLFLPSGLVSRARRDRAEARRGGGSRGRWGWQIGRSWGGAVLAGEDQGWADCIAYIIMHIGLHVYTPHQLTNFTKTYKKIYTYNFNSIISTCKASYYIERKKKDKSWTEL